ncbi:MAG TPA: dihydrofolate reductase family protein [Bryobacteraceae bacterium]|nr:dihydrofolate reductase family protein [Bryobacteraceae bacterium]
MSQKTSLQAKRTAILRRHSNPPAKLFLRNRQTMLEPGKAKKCEGCPHKSSRRNTQVEARAGQNIIGGADIPSQLIRLGLVDECRFVVQPILAGEGRRLLEGVNLPEKVQWKLVESKPFNSGCVALRYLKEREKLCKALLLAPGQKKIHYE